MNKRIFSIIVIIGVAIMIMISLSARDSKVKMQIIKLDNSNYNQNVVKIINVKENKKVKLEKYDGNNLKVLEITEEFVKISRIATRYKIINPTPDGKGESIKTEETVVELVEYEKMIPIDINARDPYGPAYVQPKYNYYIKFIKNKK